MDVGQRNRAQITDPESGRGGDAFLAALIVIALDEAALRAGIGNDERQICGKRNGAHLVAGAVNVKRVIGPPEERGKLIEQTGSNADELVLRTAAQPGNVTRLDFESVEFYEEAGYRDFKTRRARQTAAKGKIALDRGIIPGDRIAGAEQFARHTERVICPRFLVIPREDVDRAFTNTIERFRFKTNRAITSRVPANRYAAIDGSGENETKIVIGMVSEKLHTTRAVGGNAAHAQRSATYDCGENC